MDPRIHPYVVHFPVALLLVAVALFFAGAAGRGRPWTGPVLAAARWNLWIGAALALASIGTGFLDYVGNQCDADALAAPTLHRRSAAVTRWSSLIAGIAVYRTRHRAPGPLLLAWLALVAVAALTATRLGTDLTYVRGLGVAGGWPADAPLCFEAERGR